MSDSGLNRGMPAVKLSGMRNRLIVDSLIILLDLEGRCSNHLNENVGDTKLEEFSKA